MVHKARVTNKIHRVSCYIIVWLVCLSSILSITIKNIDTVKSKEGKSESKVTATFVFEATCYAAIFFVLYHLYRINDNTMQLAIQIEST